MGILITDSILEHTSGLGLQFREFNAHYTPLLVYATSQIELTSQVFRGHSMFPSLIQLLVETLDAAPEMQTRASCACAILLLARNEAQRVFLDDIRHRLKSESERLACDVQLSRLGVSIAEDRLREVVNAYRKASQLVSAFGGSSLVDPLKDVFFPWFVPSISGEIARMLLVAPFINLQDTAEALAETIRKSNRLNVHVVCNIAKAYWGDVPIALEAKSPILSCSQVTIMKAIAQNDALWEANSPIYGKLQCQLGVDDSEYGRKTLYELIESSEINEPR